MTDRDLHTKIDYDLFEAEVREMDHPEVISKLDFVYITLVCRELDDVPNDIWEQDGGTFVTIMIPFSFGVSHSKEMVTGRFLEVYRQFVGEITEVPNIASLEAGI